MNRRRFGLLLLGLSLVACNTRGEGAPTPPTSPDPAPGAATTTKSIYVVRHAEKQITEGEADPELTEAGRARAQALPAALADVTIEEVYSSRYRRTQQTVAPVAEAAGLEILAYDPADSPALAARLLASPATHILVAGHSNSVPGLIEALGAEPPSITDEQYGDLFVITVDGDEVSLETRHYGD